MSEFGEKAGPEKPVPKFVIIESSTGQSNPNGTDVLQNQLVDEDKKVDNRGSRDVIYSKEKLAARRIIYPGMKDSRTLNSFRSLRTSLLKRMECFNSCVLVTSVVRGGGASFTATNLAAAFTFSQQRNALLIECNFENPSLAKGLGVEPEAGLIDYVSDSVNEIQSLIYPTLIPRLSLVPRGPIVDEDQIEFFSGNKMQAFLNDVKNRYDDRVLIVDAPPILESADTKILSDLCDHVVLVLPYQRVSSNRVNKAIREIGSDKIAGMVLNN